MSDDKPQKTSNFQGIINETEEVTVDEEGKETTEVIEEIDKEKLETYLKDLDNDMKKMQTYLSRYIAGTSNSVGDADWDTIIYTEKTTDEDKVRINIAGTEIIVIDASGIAVAATQPAGAPADTLVKENILRGWISFDGSGTIAISDSYNVASITDTNVGRYTVTWNVGFASADYAVSGAAGDHATGDLGTLILATATAVADTWCRIQTRTLDGTLTDFPTVTLIVIGDQ